MGASAEVEAVGEKTRLPPLEEHEMIELAEEVARGRGRPLEDDRYGDAEDEEPGIARPSGARYDVACDTDVVIHNVLSCPAMAIRRDGPDGVVAVHATTRSAVTGSAPPTSASGRKGITSGGSVMQGLGKKYCRTLSDRRPRDIVMAGDPVRGPHLPPCPISAAISSIILALPGTPQQHNTDCR